MAAAGKSPLDYFHRDCLKFGSLKCFKHFSVYLKGREELLLTLSTGNPRQWQSHHQHLDSDSHASLVDNQLPPASPSSVDEEELAHPEATRILIGSYARYKRPYAWLRSPAQSTDINIDTPMDLETSKTWPGQGLTVWDMVAELTTRFASPVPHNPFEVDMAALMAMPPLERALQAGAMAGFLRDVMMSNVPYAAAMAKDLASCMHLHFQGMPALPSSSQPHTPSSSNSPSLHSSGVLAYHG